LNRVVPEALARLKGPLDDWQIVHQTGHAALIETRGRYAATGRWAWLQPFFANIAELLASADLVVCRGGGTTLSELAALGVPAIVVPYPHAADDHQLHNARAYASRGACRIVDFRTVGLPAAALACELADLAMNSQAREELAAGMRSLARPCAAADVAGLVLDEVRCIST
jgi:UDP-N-acetylglucosamine--N-acetylmuramyl-(pentapeptide) pyrophosphoryl-undecaprenol N-acetylglucosamine transferase